jgi:TolA-binding protein
MSRMSRKEIKRDELATTLESLTLAAEHHARSLMIAAVAAVVLIAAVTAGIWYSRSRAADAALQFAQLQHIVEAPISATGAPGVLSYATPQARAEDLLRRADTLVSAHPSSPQGRWAAYWKAVALKDLGRHDEALAALAPLASSADDPFLSSSAKMQQAQVSEAKGDLSGAAEAYAGLAAAAPARFPVEMALMAQARVLEAQGKAEEARALYRRVTQEYPESPYAEDAGRRLAPAAS